MYSTTYDYVISELKISSMVTKWILNYYMKVFFSAKLTPKINVINFGNQTSDINISAPRYDPKMFLYPKRIYEYEFSIEYSLIVVE